MRYAIPLTFDEAETEGDLWVKKIAGVSGREENQIIEGKISSPTARKPRYCVLVEVNLKLD